MKYYLSVTNLHFSWDQVMSGFWNRYPNPFSTHVLTEDTITRQIRNKKLLSKRLITKMNKVPKWGEHFFSGPKFVCIIEESILDPKKKVLQTYTRNVGYSKVMLIEEKCTYRQSPENPRWTQCERQAWITSNVFGFAYALQTLGLERFRANASKTVKGFEFVLNKMYNPETFNTGVTEMSKLAIKKEQLKTTAKKAKEIAKEKAAPVMAKYGGTAAS